MRQYRISQPIQLFAEISAITPALTCKTRHAPSREEHPERWPSGLRRTLGKRVCGKLYRGFESHSLRHLQMISVYSEFRWWPLARPRTRRIEKARFPGTSRLFPAPGNLSLQFYISCGRLRLIQLVGRLGRIAMKIAGLAQSKWRSSCRVNQASSTAVDCTVGLAPCRVNAVICRHR